MYKCYLVILENCSIVENEGRYAVETWSSNSRIRNCIIRNPQGEIDLSGSWPRRAEVTYCNIEGGYVGEGNIDADPMFIKPWDGLSADLRLLADSACIDGGKPAAEFNDACLPPGLESLRNDMGAFGGPDNCGWLGLPPFVSTPTPTTGPEPTETPHPSQRIPDYEGFGKVNSGDLLLLIDQGIRQGDPAYDLTDDGNCDASDLFVFSVFWQWSAESVKVARQAGGF